NVYQLKIQSYNAQNRLVEALNTGLEVLKLLGISFPQNPNALNIVAGLMKTKLSLGLKRIEDLANLPEMTDPNQQAAMRILSGIISTAVQAKPRLVPLLAFRMVKLCIKHGNSPYASIAYIYYAVVMCKLGDISLAYQFGQLAIRLLDKFPSRSIKSRVYPTFGSFIHHWKASVKSGLGELKEGFKNGMETGDLEFAGYSIGDYCFKKMSIGEPLDLVEQETGKYMKLMQQSQLEMAVQYLSIGRQTALNLRGHSVEPCDLVGDNFNELNTLPVLIESQSFVLVGLVYYAKTQLNFIFRNYGEALENSRLFEKYEEVAAGFYVVSLNNFYSSLSLLALYPQAEKWEQKQYLKKVLRNQKKMKKWAVDAPMNYQHKYDLVA
ncbi:serine/threonine protein kinase, partial [Microcoleus sp. herbarium8]